MLPPTSSSSVRQVQRGFTLVELLVAMTVLIILIVAMVGLTNQANGIWRSSRTRITAFQGARTAFDRITTNLSQATLNTYLDYYNSTGVSRSDLVGPSAGTLPSNAVLAAFKPSTYDRASDLQFICGQGGQSVQGSNALVPPPSGDGTTRPTHALFFQCPLGHVSDPHVSDPNSPGTTGNDFSILTRTLNAVGYYIQFSDGNAAGQGLVPAFITNPVPPPAWRYRLMELNQSSEYLDLYATRNFTQPPLWFTMAVNQTGPPLPPVYSIADNIVALIVRPKAANPTSTNATPTEIAPNYAYNTKGYLLPNPDPNAKIAKNQLPPLVQVTLVAIDEDSAMRLATRKGSTPPITLNSRLFTDVTMYDTDLNASANPNYGNSLTLTLQNLHLNYRIFVTDVSIPGAKWSQTN